MRLFVSVDLPDLAAAVESVQEQFDGASGLDLTDPEQAHVTLKFLGDVDESSVPGLADALADAVASSGVAPFEATFGGLGVFPSLDYVNVVWLGVRDGGEELARLHESVEETAVSRGFDPEDHEFTPHVTLARMRHAGGKELVQDVVRDRDPTVGSTRVADVRLTESVRAEDGPSYSTVERFPLPGDGG